jgi:outer membrane lipoprotein-sorting protein
LEGTINTLTKSPSTEAKTTMTFTLVFQKPNKFRVVMKDPKGQVQQLIVSDGNTMFFEFPALKQVLKRPAPKEGVPISGGKLLAGSLKEQLAKVKEAKIVGEEKIGQRKAKVIEVVAEDGTTALLWIADNTLWQTRVTLEGKRFIRSAGPKEQPNPFAEAMKQTTITQTISFSKVDFNPRLSSNIFAYKPPAGFKVVEKLEMPMMQPSQRTKPTP